MKKQKILLSVWSILLLVSCHHSVSNDKNVSQYKDEPLQKVTIVLDWTPNTNHTGIYVAKDKGYFAEQGLSVEIIQPSEDGAELLVASQKAMFGISFQDTLASVYEKELPIMTIGAIVAHNTSGILSLKEKNIQSPKQLEHKNYATWGLPIEEAIVKHIVESDNGNIHNVNKVYTTVTDVVSALQTNIDAVWIFEGWDKIVAEQKGLSVNFIDIKSTDSAFDYYTPVIITNKEMISKQPELVKKFMCALSKGYTYSAQHADEVADILLTYVPELDKNLVRDSQRFLSTQYIDTDKPWGYIDSKRWNTFYQWLNDTHLLEKFLIENEGFTNDFITN